MKMENITILQLVKAYLHTTYPGRDTLVVDLTDVEYDGEVDYLHELLTKHGCKVPDCMKLPGWLIVEMNRCAATAICNEFNKGFTRIYVFCGGECLHENY